MPIYLCSLPVADPDCELGAYCEAPAVARLGWPVPVVEQWLFDHREKREFIDSYGSVDLSRIVWRLETLAVEDFEGIPTGADVQRYLDEVPAEHEHWTNVRPAAVRESWDVEGSWLVPPLLISRSLLPSPALGLQLVEGRTRVGILRGRRAAGVHVSARHLAWVGRPA